MRTSVFHDHERTQHVGVFRDVTERRQREDARLVLLELLEGGDFDVILMDIQLPVMDGMETTAAIRTLPEFKGKAAIPIITMTAYAMDGDRERFMAGGLDGYIAKPVSMRELHAEIGRVMAGSGKG